MADPVVSVERRKTPSIHLPKGRKGMKSSTFWMLLALGDGGRGSNLIHSSSLRPNLVGPDVRSPFHETFQDKKLCCLKVFSCLQTFKHQSFDIWVHWMDHDLGSAQVSRLQFWVLDLGGWWDI